MFLNPKYYDETMITSIDTHLKAKAQRAERRDRKIHPEIGGVKVSGKKIPERRREIRRKRNILRDHGYLGAQQQIPTNTFGHTNLSVTETGVHEQGYNTETAVPYQVDPNSTVLNDLPEKLDVAERVLDLPEDIDMTSDEIISLEIHDMCNRYASGPKANQGYADKQEAREAERDLREYLANR